MRYEGFYWVCKFTLSYVSGIIATNLIFIAEFKEYVLIGIAGCFFFSLPAFIIGAAIYFFAFRFINRFYYLTIPIAAAAFFALINFLFFGSVSFKQLQDGIGGNVFILRVSLVACVLAAAMQMYVIRRQRRILQPRRIP